jgi:hypothetical protein
MDEDSNGCAMFPGTKVDGLGPNEGRVLFLSRLFTTVCEYNGWRKVAPGAAAVVITRPILEK